MIELKINYDEQTGNVNVSGPINNKGLCYMMMECARDAVKDHVDRNQSQPQESQTPLILPIAKPAQNGIVNRIPARVKRRR